jgi:hypothetical protein
MSWRKFSYGIVIGLCFVAGAVFFVTELRAFQRPFHQYPGVEYRQFETPEDWQQTGEWAFARLMFPPGPLDGYYPRFQGDWHNGLSLWTQDYPRADRHFSLALRRLSRLEVRSVEQPVNLEDGSEVYNWPWLYAVQVGEWGLNEDQAQVLREYLLRGGFFMADDFHGTDEWAEFEKRIKFVFPDRPIEEIDDNDAIFHTVYDLNDRIQVPGWEHLGTGYKKDGIGAHWRAIYDDHRRIMVAISFNSDLGDAWEWADDPRYPEKFSGLAIRVGVNYVLYSMTH